MGSVRRWAILPVLALLIAALAAISMPLDSASTAPGPGTLNYVCALKNDGLLGYAAIPAECGDKGIGTAPHQHKPPVLAGIETAALRHTAGHDLVASRTVLVTRGKPPVAVDDTATTGKNTAINITVLAKDTDPADLPLTVASVGTTGTKGTVLVNGNGTIRYDPDGQFADLTAGQTATDSFTYKATDGHQTSNSATVTVTITGSNDAPVLSNIETTPLGYQSGTSPVAVTSRLTVSDGDTTMSGATVSITSGFDPADDALAFAGQNGITGSYNLASGVLTLTGAASIGDYQSALRSVEFVSFASPGAVRSVSFTVTDSLRATSAAATRTIDVTGAPPPPTVSNQSYRSVGNTPLGVGTTPAGPAFTWSGGVLNGDTDADPAATLSVTAVTTPAHGTVTVGPNGAFTYLPNPGYSGTDSFQCTIAGSNDPSATATETVTITVGTVIWYVNDSMSAAGNGEAATPFNTLAAANAAARANSILFLYQGSAAYTGGVIMHPGEDLYGQPYGLTVWNGSSFEFLVPEGGSRPTITNGSGNGNGIVLADHADVEDVNVTNPSGNGIAAANVNDASVGVTDPVAISGAGGDGIFIVGGDGYLTFGNTSVTGSAGDSVSVAGRTGSTVKFNGPISGTGGGISLTNNAGATIAFNGPLTLSTGPNAAFTATGGGTVTAFDYFAASTLTTTTGNAVTVQNTTIGAAGLRFQSVSSSGSADGIDLTNTGSSGSLTITGTGAAQLGSGGTIQNSTGEGIQLASTYAPSFSDMVIKNNAANGINGTQVNGLTLADCTVSGNGTPANVSGENDDGLDFSPNGTGNPDGLTGTVSITNSVITDSADNNAVISDTSGTLGLAITATTFSSDNASTGKDGLHIDANGTTTATVSVTGSTFTNNVGNQLQFFTGSTSTGANTVTFSNNTLNSTGARIRGGGVLISSSGNSQTLTTVDDNSIQNAVGNGIGIDEDDGGTYGEVSGVVNGNTIGAPAAANSGGGTGIDISDEGQGGVFLGIGSNDLFQYSNEAGIHFVEGNGNPDMGLGITDNTIAAPGEHASWGILGQDGAQTTDNGTLCADITGNSIAGSGQVSRGGADIELDQNDGTTFELPGYTGGADNTSTVRSFLEGNNNVNGTPTAIASVSGTGVGFVTGCSY